MTLHTSPNCSVGGLDCNKDNGNTGCGMQSRLLDSYGAGFNQQGGGVYAMEWTSSAIKIWFFPRQTIPTDGVEPDPSTWGLPSATFTAGSTCDFDAHFRDLRIVSLQPPFLSWIGAGHETRKAADDRSCQVINLTFCGDWAGGNAYASCQQLVSPIASHAGFFVTGV